MGPYLEMPYIYVCSWCHELPFLFFPDKVMKRSLRTVPPNREAIGRQSKLKA
jgi:hypothetical protein